MHEIKLDNFKQYTEIVENLKGNWVFRGHFDSSWKIETSIFRFFKHIQSYSRLRSHLRKIEAEKQIITEFIRVSHSYNINLPKTDNLLEWLSVMQHYGTPTRLLDVTRSPYIALFFALDEGNQDASVYFIKPVCFSKKDKIHLNDEKGVYNYLFNNPINRESKVALYFPEWSTERLVKQQGLFLVPNTLDKSLNDTIESYMPSSNEMFKIIIPQKLRAQGIRYLIDMNLTSATLYPGFEGYCRSLRNQLFTFILNSTKINENKNSSKMPSYLPR